MDCPEYRDGASRFVSLIEMIVQSYVWGDAAWPASQRRLTMDEKISPVDLPAAIDAYFAADRSGDLDALASCFTADALVRDEGRDHIGVDAIRRWKADASRAYNYTVTPFALLEDAGRTIVTSRLVGNFPGNPVDLRYKFRLEGDRIAGLEIRP